MIVTFQSRETIGAALSTLEAAYESGLAHCLVVDNASTDGTLGYVRDHFPWVTIIPSAANLGFGRGCNLGFERVETPYVLFLNPDASIDLRALRILIDFMDAHPDAGILGPATEWGDNPELHQGAGRALTPQRLIRAALGMNNVYPDERPIVPGGKPFRTSWVCGAVMLIRASSFRELGGFDPRFFLYFEETDLCLRALHHGLEIWAVGESTAKHMGGVSAKQSGENLTTVGAGNIVEHFYRSRFYFLVKHFGLPWAVTAELTAAVAAWLRWGTGKLRHKPSRSRLAELRRPYFRLPTKVRVHNEAARLTASTPRSR